MARIGILGGSFNPPHLGHLLLAQEARIELELDSVLLVPAARPPHKALEADPGAATRLALCQAAVAGDPGLAVSSVELDRPGTSFTVDTLRALHDASPEDELTLLVGGDQAAAFSQWRDPEGILALASLGVAERAEHRRAAIEARLGALPAAAGRVEFFAMPRFDVTSSSIRARVRAGQPIAYLVPERVAALVEAGGLYLG